MYPISTRFLKSLRSPSMRLATRVAAIDQDGNETELRVESGSVTMDAGRSIIRTCELKLTATNDMTLEQVFDLVMTPGIEVRVARGLKFASGDSPGYGIGPFGLTEFGGDTPAELVPLGVFSTDSAQYSRRVTGAISWSGSDRSKKIARARFTAPYQITAGTDLATAITNLLKTRWQFTQVSFGNVSGAINANIVFEAGASSDPWKEARSLMADYGFDLNFDGDGVARAQPVPDPATSPAVFDYGAGETNLIDDANVSATLERTYNGVIASGEGTEVATPVRALVWDEDPTSPTYYLSGFGQVPYFYSSPQLTTLAQCQVAASTILARVKGRAQGLSWSSVVNPGLEPLDVVTNTVRGVTSRVVIDQITTPLGASEAQKATARETAVVA